MDNPDSLCTIHLGLLEFGVRWPPNLANRSQQLMSMQSRSQHPYPHQRQGLGRYPSANRSQPHLHRSTRVPYLLRARERSTTYLRHLALSQERGSQYHIGNLQSHLQIGLRSLHHCS